MTWLLLAIMAMIPVLIAFAISPEGLFPAAVVCSLAAIVCSSRTLLLIRSHPLRYDTEIRLSPHGLMVWALGTAAVALAFWQALGWKNAWLPIVLNLGMSTLSVALAVWIWKRSTWWKRRQSYQNGLTA